LYLPFFTALNCVAGIDVHDDSVWSQVQISLKEKLGAQSWEIWIRPIQLASIDKGQVQLEVPNRYYRDWVQHNYATALCQELEEVIGHPVDLQFHVAKRSETSPKLNASSKTSPSTIPGVDPENTFDRFVVGNSNEFAHAAAMAVAEEPGETQYSPLFIYGETGLGKTHLLHAIGNQIIRDDPEARVLYVTAEQFTNELIDSLRYRRMPEFRDRYRKQPTLLLMDDVQFLSGKDRTQEELFHTFEWLNERGHQIVFTADVLPRDIRMFEPRLRTRCESGMLADTQPPDMETMLAILRQKSERLNLCIPDDLALWIIARLRGNIRELEGVVNRLGAVVRLRPQALTIETAQRHLASALGVVRPTVTAEAIIEKVSSFYNIKISEIKGHRRLKQLVRPRHVAMYLVRSHTNHSFPEIGRIFGGRDHATVQHACKKIRRLMQTENDIRNAIHTLERNLSV
jgi:chromosomal replication initiator protein